MNKLNSYRNSIQELDKEILNMLCQRIQFAKKIGKIKEKNNQPIYVPEVEKKKIEELSTLSTYPGLVETIWPVIMCYTRSVE